MKSYLKTIFQTVIVLLVASCNNSLDERVYSEVTESSYKYSVKDTYAVIGNGYTSLRDFFQNAQLNYWTVQEACTDEIVMPANASGWDNGGEFKRLHWHAFIADQRQANNFWNSAFTGVVITNRIIDQLQKDLIPISSDLNKEALIAEMRATRALYYWLLTDNWGDIPFVAEVTQELPPKASRNEIYQFLVKELSESIPKLSEDTGTLMYGRFNKWAAKALRANIYLNAEVYTGTAQWNNCLKECEDIIASGKYLLEKNYKDVFKVKNENSPEIIFSIPFNVINAVGWNIPFITLEAASKATFNMQTSPAGAGTVKAIPQFIDTYDPTDGRLFDTWLMGPQFAFDGKTPILGSYDKQGKQINYTKEIANGLYTEEDEGYRVIKYEIESGYQALNNDFPFFRYAQILMMKAECLLRTSHADDAATIVTQVRQRNFKTNPEKAIVTGAKLMGNSKYNWGSYLVDYGNTVSGGLNKGDQTPVQYGGLYDELGYEFVSEACRRRDMIRFGVFTKKSWLSHIPKGAYSIVLPIPQMVIDSNPNIEQNPNYK